MKNLPLIFGPYSTQVFAGFDDALILSMGQTAFCGPAKDLGAYCASIGKPLPAQANPAEFFLDLINTDFTSEVGVKKILAAWEARATPRPVVLDPSGTSVETVASVGFCRQWWLLTKVGRPTHATFLYASGCA